MQTWTIGVNDVFRRRVLERARREGEVTVSMESWNPGFGLCDTCSWPETGFIVSVDGEQVYPPGGEPDTEGYTENGNLIVWGDFMDWLDGRLD